MWGAPRGGVDAEDGGRVVTEESPVADTPRAARLLAAEAAVRAGEELVIDYNHHDALGP